MKEHELKIWPHWFDSVVKGENLTQLRKNDRRYKKGDTLRLREWMPKTIQYTGRETTVLITEVLKNVPGLTKGYCVLSIKLVGNLMTFRAPKKPEQES